MERHYNPLYSCITSHTLYLSDKSTRLCGNAIVSFLNDVPLNAVSGNDCADLKRIGRLGMECTQIGAKQQRPDIWIENKNICILWVFCKTCLELVSF